MKAKRVARPAVEETSDEPLLELVGTRSARGTTLAVRQAGITVAAAVFRVHGEDAELVAMVTEPGHRHRGFGRLLVDEVMRRAMVAGCLRLRVRVRVTDEVASAFFRHLGFDESHRAFDRRLR